VIGIGNTLMGDDGIGPAIVSELREAGLDHVELFDLGSSGMKLIHVLSELDAAVLIDAADIGREPGEWVTFSPEEVVSLAQERGPALHEWDLITTLDVSYGLNEAPRVLTIMAVQPYSMGGGEGISEVLHERMSEYVGAVLSLIKDMEKDPLDAQ